MSLLSSDGGGWGEGPCGTVADSQSGGHWGSDQQGIDTTRRFLLEWLSYLHRYVPAGLLEQGHVQKLQMRPPHYFGRSDLETLLASPQSSDWVKISELIMGPVSESFEFIEKHKSSAYNPNIKMEDAM